MNALVRSVRWLGQPASLDLVAWEAYVKALRSSVQTSWDLAQAAYVTLKKVREGLGLPFIVNSGSPEAGTGPAMSTDSAWQSDLDQQAVDVMGMVVLCTGALDDVVRPEKDPQKRKLVWDPSKNDFGIEALPGDLLRLELQSSPSGQPIPVLISASGPNANQPTHITGSVGAVPLLLVGAAVALTIVQTVGAVIVVKAACETLQTIAEQKTLRTVAEKQAELVASGKATPEQASAMSKAVYNGATELEKAKIEKEAAGSKTTTDITDTIKLVALVGLGIAVLYTVIRFVPAPAPRAAAPALPNPRRRMLDNPVCPCCG